MSVKSIISTTIIVFLCSSGFALAEDYRLELIDRQSVSALKGGRPQYAKYSLYAKSYIQAELQNDNESYKFAKYYDSTNTLVWSDTVGLNIYLGYQDDFFVTTFPLGSFHGSKARIYNLSLSSTSILDTDFNPSKVIFSKDKSFVCLGGSSIMLCDSSGTVYFKHTLRMRMSSKLAINSDASLIAVGDLLWSSDLNEHKYYKQSSTAANKDYINPTIIPCSLNLKTEEEIEEYKTQRNLEKKQLQKERRDRAGIRPTPTLNNKPTASSEIPQYVTILDRNGFLVEEISIPAYAQKIAISQTNNNFIVLSDYTGIYLMDMDGNMICKYNFEYGTEGVISSVAASDNGFILAVVNESKFRENQKRKLIAIDFDGSLIAEIQLLDLWASEGRRVPNILINGNTITLIDNAEISIFRFVIE